MDGRPLALTMGEPAGIGGEIALKAWNRRNEDHLPCFFVIDDPNRLRALAQQLSWPIRLETIAKPADAPNVFSTALPVLPLGLDVQARPGILNPSQSSAVLRSIEMAVGFVKSGDAAALVTNPIHKAVLGAAGFKHPGHTEFLAELAGDKAMPVMMLTGGDLRVVPVTIHIPLAEVPGKLTAKAISRQGGILADALSRDFAISKPRIAVAGLNPHAGEEGVLGGEEENIIRPAIKELRAKGIDAFGPLPADTMFHAEARATFDAALCMYHDQALIPVKMLGFWEGVNVTLGLPFLRTSPDHGTALALAGSGKANPASLMAALKLARKMADARAAAA